MYLRALAKAQLLKKLCFQCFTKIVHELMLKNHEAEKNPSVPMEAAKKSLPLVPNDPPTKKVLKDPETERDPSVPLEFPKRSDPSAPIVSGTFVPFIPPKKFPSDSSEQNSTGPPVLSITDTANITKIKNSHMNIWLNRTQNTQDDKSNSTAPEKATSIKDTKVETAEQEDMLHSKYTGGQDVDELKQPKKASEKDEKKETQAKKDPNSEVIVTPNFDKKGPKSMNDTKLRAGTSLVESASGMVAVSSSMLLNSQPKHRGIIEPAKTIITVLLSAGFILAVGVIGLLVWKRISMRRFGRDVLINEEDFDEVSDMHSFDRAQIQIT